ncbi:MAG: hypothetical protein KOO66_04390 [Bacteroidales bacterium]|nr:hypothetical protein [Bacteroidales bacterium]
MINISKVLFLCGIIFLMVFSCEEDIVDTGDLEPMEIKKITDFGCDDCYLLLKPEYVNDAYYLIYSESDITKYVTGENIPKIDFEKYLLIIGTKSIDGGGSITDEKAEGNNIEIIYRITITRDDTHIAGISLPYHAFLEKSIKEKAVRVEVIVKP